MPERFDNISQENAFQSQLNAEINKNGDLLIVNVIDMYMHITNKILALFNFVLTSPDCAPGQAPLLRYVFKGNDDIYVNPTRFLMQFEEIESFQISIRSSSSQELHYTTLVLILFTQSSAAVNAFWCLIEAIIL